MAQVPTTPDNLEAGLSETESHAAEAAISETQAATNERVARATGIMALGNIASRVLGLVREVVLTYFFGASRSMDAFNVALIIPTALYDLLIAGHVNSAIIPVLSEVTTLKGRGELWRLVSVLLSIVTVVLSGLIVVLQVFAPQVMSIISGSDPQTLELATMLFRVTAPGLIFMSLFAVLSGTLYALRTFTYPALAGALFNGAIVLVTVFFVPPPQFVPVFTEGGIVTWTEQRPVEGITVVAIGWLIGALVQLLFQFFGLREARLRFTLRWRHPAVRRIAYLYTPIMLSLIMDTLIIRPFSYNLAIQSGVGGSSYMKWATTLIQFPQGLVATAISIAILPTLARQAALVAADDPEQSRENRRAYKDTLGLGLRLATTLILPATVGLFVLATPIVALLFEHGAFDTYDTLMTTLTLRLYLIGLPFAAVDLLLVYAFYARQDTVTPALIGVLSLVVYMVTALTLQPQFGLFSLMIADSLKHITHATVSAYVLHRRLDGLGGQRLTLTLMKTLIAAAAMGAAVLLIEPSLEVIFAGGGIVREVALVGISGIVCLVVFFGVAALIGIEELRWLYGLVKRKLSRSTQLD